MTWKLCPELSLHESIIYTYSLAQRHKLVKQPHKFSLIHPTDFCKCKFSFTYFTSDHMYVYKNTKWQAHSQMSSHTTHPLHTHKTDRCTRYKSTHALTHIHHNQCFGIHTDFHRYTYAYPDISRIIRQLNKARHTCTHRGKFHPPTFNLSFYRPR